VAEGDLLLAAAAPMIFFVPTLFRLAVGGTVDGVRGLPILGALPKSAALPTPLPLLVGLPTLFEPGVSVSPPGAAAVGFSVSSTVGSVTTVGSEVFSPALGSEDAPGSALFIVSSATVAPKDVLSCVVDSGGSSLLGPPAKIPLSWAAETPATANNSSTKVVRTTARCVDGPVYTANAAQLSLPRNPKHISFIGCGPPFSSIATP
jgi:hypothetical protein